MQDAGRISFPTTALHLHLAPAPPYGRPGTPCTRRREAGWRGRVAKVQKSPLTAKPAKPRQSQHGNHILPRRRIYLDSRVSRWFGLPSSTQSAGIAGGLGAL